ncbi:hypothetical protein ACTHO0_22985 [Cytobacillus praedii]|uniref:hypothetical protein n=1 Tax=Cytobacillus praedii TaxID=1742358 RepID=UPI003F81B16A
MKTIVYNIHTSMPCGEVLPNDTPENEIIRNAIPNFGGTEPDYSFIEVDEETYKKLSDYHFTIVDGEIVLGDKKVIEDPPNEPSDIEKLKEENLTLMDATATLYIENLALKEEVTHLKNEDLNNKEAIADLYILTTGGA